MLNQFLAKFGSASSFQHFATALFKVETVFSLDFLWNDSDKFEGSDMTVIIQNCQKKIKTQEIR